MGGLVTIWAYTYLGHGLHNLQVKMRYITCIIIAYSSVKADCTINMI